MTKIKGYHYFRTYTMLICFSAIILLTSIALHSFWPGPMTAKAKQPSILTANIHSKKANEMEFLLRPIETKDSSQLVEGEPADRKIVYITFDDGPSKYTNDILRILNDNGATASFFLLKGNITRYPEMVKKINRFGHAIGCHGVSHRLDEFYASASTPLQEMKSCKQSLIQVDQINSNLIRVPFGSYPHLTEDQKALLDHSGFILWDWNIDSNDWQAENAGYVIDKVYSQISNIEQNTTSVPTILLHETEITVQALPKIINHLVGKGYAFKKISEETPPIAFNRYK